MANKNTIRSIRISDEMLQLIERQVGSTFTEKWENLIIRCTWELSSKEEELRRIQERIDYEKKRLSEIQCFLHDFEAIEERCVQARSLLRSCLERMEKL